MYGTRVGLLGLEINYDDPSLVVLIQSFRRIWNKKTEEDNRDAKFQAFHNKRLESFPPLSPKKI